MAQLLMTKTNKKLAKVKIKVVAQQRCNKIIAKLKNNKSVAKSIQLKVAKRAKRA